MFDPVHLAPIAFMIIAQKVQNSMQDEHAKLKRERAAMHPRKAPGGFRGDCNVAQILSPIGSPDSARLFPMSRQRRKRKHIGRPWFPAESLIHFRDFCIAHQSDDNVSIFQIKFFTHLAQKVFQRPGGNADLPLAV
ncbi:MAG TPA: hypothetical protein VLV88_16040 [Terriglobales bacterium]|nr:hypothetical protein [Terriglobales bacterium]